jgi:hypothetical protein
MSEEVYFTDFKDGAIVHIYENTKAIMLEIINEDGSSKMETVPIDDPRLEGHTFIREHAPVRIKMYSDGSTAIKVYENDIIRDNE